MDRELVERVTALAPTEGLHRTRLERVLLHRRTRPTSLGPRVLGSGLGVVLGGRKQFTVAGRAFDYRANDWLVTSHQVATTCVVTSASDRAPYLALVVRLDARLVAECMALTDGDHAHARATALPRSRLDATLADVLRRLVRALESPRDAHALGPLLERELIYRLLQSEQAAVVRRLGLADRAVLQVLAAIEAHYAAGPSVEELARSVHLGVSSLHHRFKAATGTSPRQYLKRVRLREARRLMLEQHVDAARAAYAVGYASASQFSRDYRAAYALPPRRDVARLAGTSSAG